MDTTWKYNPVKILIMALIVSLCLPVNGSSQESKENKDKSLNAANIEEPLEHTKARWRKAMQPSPENLKNLGNVYGLEFDVFEGENRNVYGVDIAGIFATTINDVTGIQTGGVTSVTMGTMTGAQISGLLNLAGKTKGIQISGLGNFVEKKLTGIQASVFSNRADQVKGMQIGISNNCKKMKGVQIGLFNRIDNGILPFFPIINMNFSSRSEE